MFYNNETEENAKYYLILRKKIDDLFEIKYKMPNEFDREECVDWVIEQILIMRSKNEDKNKSIKENAIKKACYFSYMKFYNKQVRIWLIKKVPKLERVWWTEKDIKLVNKFLNEEKKSYEAIYVINIENEESKNALENIWKDDEDNTNILNILKKIENNLGIEVKEIAKLLLKWYSNLEIANKMDISSRKVKYNKSKIKEFIKENKDII